MDQCIICRGEYPITENNPLTDEHIVPEFLGGNLTQKNVCKTCNSNMGGGFEGELANSFLYGMYRHRHNILGKKSSLKNPLAGTYHHDKIGKFTLNDDGSLTTFPEIDVTENEHELSVSLRIDRDQFDKAKPILEKKLIRYLDAKGAAYDHAKLRQSIDDLLANAPQKHSTYDQPEIHKRISFDIDATIFLYSKITYELAAFHFGNEYIDDPIADKLRLMLKEQKPDESLHGKFPISREDYANCFDDHFHWVVFTNNACLVKVFGLAGVIMYCLENSPFKSCEGVVYKFCFKTLTHEVSTLQQHVSKFLRPQ